MLGTIGIQYKLHLNDLYKEIQILIYSMIKFHFFISRKLDNNYQNDKNNKEFNDMI